MRSDGCAISDALDVLVDASTEGFGWRAAMPAWTKVAEEVEELRVAIRAGSSPAIHEELGDVLFAAIGLALWLDVEPSAALRASTDKFEARLRTTRALAGPDGFATASVEELVTLWREAKQAIG